MREPENIRQLLSLQPDFVGFIFYPKSPRYAGNAAIPFDFPDHIQKIGVFVDEEETKIIDTARQFGLHGIQLHGHETPGQCKALKESGLIVIKAFAIDESSVFEMTEEYEPVSDYFLFDTKTSLLGGSGKAFNWEILKKYNNRKPFFLSGGIGPEHIDELGRLWGLNLFAIDINSRFELMPGAKDIAKIRAFKDKLAGFKIGRTSG